MKHTKAIKKLSLTIEELALIIRTSNGADAESIINSLYAAAATGEEIEVSGCEATQLIIENLNAKKKRLAELRERRKRRAATQKANARNEKKSEADNAEIEIELTQPLARSIRMLYGRGRESFKLFPRFAEEMVAVVGEPFVNDIKEKFAVLWHYVHTSVFDAQSFAADAYRRSGVIKVRRCDIDVALNKLFN